MHPEVLLSASAITKSYDGVHALNRASFELRAGEVHALIGENGAGKSTLIKIITGALEADEGELRIKGEVISHNSPGLAKARGIAAIYQQPALFPELTVAENITMGLENSRALSRVDWQFRKKRAKDLLARVEADINPDTEASALSMPQQQLAEIARALGAQAEVLILDEPTASLSEKDVTHLFGVLRQLRSEGVGIIYISHRLEELPVIADRVTVLRDGCTVATHSMGEIDRQQLIQLMVGRELSTVFPKRQVAIGSDVLELRGLGCSTNGIHEVNLTIHAGEVVGLAGLVGAGRTELARTIFGLEPADKGEIRLDGRPVRIQSPAEAIKARIAYLPEDRRRHGVIPEMPLDANITLASLERLSRFGSLNFSRERELAVEYTQRMGIRADGIFSPVATLSGGNQQKVALSRWLATGPRILVFDEPTQGIDVGSKSEIHGLMVDLASQGVAILMISSELPEILGMSDRIAVMHKGTIKAIIDRAQATQQRVLDLALGRGGAEC